MADDLAINIRAHDDASAAIAKINSAIAKVSAPVEKVQKRISRFGESGQASLDKLQKGFGGVANAARGVVDKIVEIIPGLTAIGGAASLAGLSALAVKFGNFGFSLNKSSKLLGMNAQDLAAWHVAAKRAGVSAEEFDSSMSSSQMAIRGAAYGANPQAMMMLQKLGVQIERNADGTVANYAKVQQQAMRAIAGIKSVEGQRDAANTLGMGSLLPMIQQGTYNEDKARAMRKGLVPTADEIARAQQFHQDINDLEDSASGLGNSIGSKLVPILDPLVRGFAKWLDGHRAQIADQIGSAVQKFATWLQSIDWDRVVSKAGKFFDAIGGIKGVAIAIAAITFSGPLAGVLSLITNLTKLATLVLPAAITQMALLGAASLVAETARQKALDKAIHKQPGESDADRDQRVADAQAGGIVSPQADAPVNGGLGRSVYRWFSALFAGKPPGPVSKAAGGAAPALRGAAEGIADSISTNASAAESVLGMGGIPLGLASRAGGDAVLAAIQTQQRYGVPAAVTLAQYGLESGFGSSGLANRSNNPFGMHAAPGQDYVWGTDDDGRGNRVPTKFAQFASIQDAFDAHAKLLAKGAAYAEARQHEDDPMAYAAALTGHYATDPRYGEKLQALMAAAPGQPEVPAPAATTEGDRDSRITQMQQAAPQIGAQQQASTVAHKITVDFKNVPKGVNVDAKSSDGGYLPTRVNYAMDLSLGAMP